MAKAGTGDRIRWFCVDCGKRVKARPEHAGNQFKCPFCENMSKVPHTSEPGAVRDKAVSASAGKERKKIVESDEFSKEIDALTGKAMADQGGEDRSQKTVIVIVVVAAIIAAAIICYAMM